MSDEIETVDKNPKSWAAWKMEAERLQAIIDDMALAAMDSEPVAWVMLEDLADKDIVSTPAYPDINDAMEMTHGELEPLYRHAQQPVVEIEPTQMFGIGSIFKPQVVSEQEADCDACAHYNPKICHGEGCPAISQQSVQPAPVVPEGLNPETTDLVLRFASALADKLYKAEQKYGRSTDWMKDDWYDDCLQSLWEHIEKGDPRDVAAYCAFMWYHGWVTTDYDRNVQSTCRAAMLQAVNSPAHSGLRPEQSNGSPAQDGSSPEQNTIDHGYRPECECSGCKTTARICAELAGNSPVIPDGYVMVPKEPTETMINAWLSEVANWRGHVAGYKAMLAAAPQEVK